MAEAREQSEAKRLAYGWNFPHVWLAFLAAILSQSLLLPCLCWEGSVRGYIAFAVDLLVLVRVAIAWASNETGRGWLFYVILLYTSAFWIEGIVWVYMKHH